MMKLGTGRAATKRVAVISACAALSAGAAGPERGGSSVTVDASTIIDNLKFTFMGTFEATKGRYGFLTDFLYIDVGGSNSNTRNLNVNGRELLIGVNTNVDLDIKGVAVALHAAVAILLLWAWRSERSIPAAGR